MKRVSTTLPPLKVTGLLFIFLFLLYGCASYTFPVSLMEAATLQRPVKVLSDNANTLRPEAVRFDYIELENGQYFGVTLDQKDTLKTPIRPQEVTQVYLRKSGMPTWAVVVLSAAGGAALLIGIAYASFSL